MTQPEIPPESMGSAPSRIALFDLDHTLLSGDSDVLWIDFLIDRNVLDGPSFSRRNVEMEARYKAGTVNAQEFADFFVGTLAGRNPAQWEPLRQAFLTQQIIPRLPDDALRLVNAHLNAGDLVVLTTATNRFITELTAQYLGIAHLIATEPEVQDGVFTGRTQGQLNMREGKVVRLIAWLEGMGLKLEELQSIAYSDSINDLPLLSVVERAVAVDPDAKLLNEATQRSWQILRLQRTVQSKLEPVQPKNPLHGVTLEKMVTELSAYFGWDELGVRIPVRCFSHDPSVKSSLKFLRRTPWAREKVEGLYLFMLRERRRASRSLIPM